MGRDQKLRQQIAAQLAQDPPDVRDTYGRPLTVGDEVIYQDQLYRVVSIAPVTAPGAPPGLQLLRLVAVNDVACPRGQPIEGLFRVRTAAEVSPRRVELTGEPDTPRDDPDAEAKAADAQGQAAIDAGVGEEPPDGQA